jgi:hypothetical protein
MFSLFFLILPLLGTKYLSLESPRGSTISTNTSCIDSDVVSLAKFTVIMFLPKSHPCCESNSHSQQSSSEFAVYLDLLLLSAAQEQEHP